MAKLIAYYSRAGENYSGGALKQIKEGNTAKVAKMLAKIMRRNIQVSNTLQPLKSELKLVEYYLKIQDYRFEKGEMKNETPK